MPNRALLSNLSLKLLSVLIASVLWFIVLGSRNVEVNKDIAVEILTPNDLVIANDVPDKVVFRMSGPKAFLRNVLNRHEEPIRINFTNAKPGLTTYRLFQDNIQVPLGVKVLSVNPSIIAVKLEQVKRKEVPLKLVTKGILPASYSLTKIELKQNSIRVRGPESKVDAISEISTMPIDLSEVRESGNREVQVDLAGFPGVWLDGASPRVLFDVSHMVSNFRLKNIGIRAQTNRRVVIEPKEVTLIVRCSAEELQQLDRSKVYGFIDLRNEKPGVHYETVKVQLPSNIKLVRAQPLKVKVTVN